VLFLCLKYGMQGNVGAMLIRLWNMLTWKTKAVFIAAFCVGGIALFYTSGTSRINDALNTAGFDMSRSESSAIRPGKVVLRGISLDSDGFSMVGEMTAHGNPLFPLIGNPSRITLNDLQLTGEWNEELGLSFAGWSLPPRNIRALANLDRVIVNDSIVDLDTPVGALRFQFKGEAARSPDNEDLYYLSANLGGKQHQITLDTRFKGQWERGKDFMLEGEIREGRINTNTLNASRLSGWLSYEQKADNPVPALSGQLQIGQFIHGDMKLNNVALTLDGDLTRPHAILNAEMVGYEGSSLLIEAQGQTEGLHILATVESPSLDKLLSILGELRKQAESAPLLQEAFMTLLITEGNMDRVRRDLNKGKYDSYVLEIEGLSHDLKGKIIAKTVKDGVMQRQIVSLNPSIAAGGN
jgi:hypothetical protein